MTPIGWHPETENEPTAVVVLSLNDRHLSRIVFGNLRGNLVAEWPLLTKLVGSQFAFDNFAVSCICMRVLTGNFQDCREHAPAHDCIFSVASPCLLKDKQCLI